MKIIIEHNSEGKSRRIWLPIPNFLFSLGRVIKFAPGNMLRVDSKPNYDAGKIKLEDENGSGDLKITKEQIKVFKRELKKMRKQYPGVPLVEIRESGGNGVSIYP